MSHFEEELRQGQKIKAAAQEILRISVEQQLSWYELELAFESVKRIAYASALSSSSK